MQISILEWFLKANVTLKTGIMAAENSDLPSQDSIIFQNIFKLKIIILICSNICTGFFFYRIFDQINSLGKHKRVLSETFKNLNYY